MAYEHKVYINSESYYFGHKRLPTDLPLETTGTGSLESPRVPVQGGSVDGLTDAGALDGTEEVPLAGGVKTTTQDIADLGGGGALGYLVYTALLSQAEEDAPTAIVLENTLSAAIVWTRTGTGVYNGTLIGAFSANKTACFFGITTGVQASLSANRASADVIELVTGNTHTENDDVLNNTPIEIRVYP